MADENMNEEDTDTSFTQKYAMAIAIMLPLGLIFGLIILDNIGLGIAFALAFAPLATIMMNQKNRERILDSGEESAPTKDPDNKPSDTI